MDWHPTQFFRSSPVPSPFALLILNQPINENAFAELYKHGISPQELYIYIYRQRQLTNCHSKFYRLRRRRREPILRAYEGTRKRDLQRISTYLSTHTKYNVQADNNQQLPNAIVGDLDSITNSVRTHYSTLGVPVVEDSDQYSTDFTKCLRFLRGHEREIVSGRYASSTTATSNGTRLEIVILGGLGGRVDQAFSQIHHLYCMSMEQGAESSSSPGGGNLYLISEESITFVLKRGNNVVHVPGTRYRSQGRSEGEGDYLQENVGIIPVTGPARITTRGFEWDVKDWRSSIGGQLSTSNHIRAETVEVESEEAVLLTIELADGLKGGRRRRDHG